MGRVLGFRVIELFFGLHELCGLLGWAIRIPYFSGFSGVCRSRVRGGGVG